MNKSKIFSILTLSLLAAPVFRAEAAVRLTALQMISSDATGKIQGVGAHRFKTTNHGGQPCLFLVKGEDLDGAILNGPGPEQNGISIPLSAGSYTYTILAEVNSSASWTYYTLDLHFDMSQSPQISALTALNISSPQYFPPSTVNQEWTQDLSGYAVKAPNSLVYKSGQTEVKLVNFQIAAPTIYNQDRVSPSQAKSNGKYDFVGQFTLEVSAPPEIAPGGVVHAASFAPKLAPGTLFSIFGTSLASAAQSAAAVPLPGSLGGTSVTIGGKTAPLVFVSPEQINAQVPYEVLEGNSVPVVVTLNGVASPASNVSVLPVAPGIFQFGQKHAVVQNQDYSTNNTDNAAAGGSYVVAYLTGSGQLDHPVATGMPAAKDPLSRPKGSVSATVNGTLAEVAFAGLTPDFTGLLQVNLKVPALAPGTYPLVITIYDQKSNEAMITVK